MTNTSNNNTTSFENRRRLVGTIACAGLTLATLGGAVALTGCAPEDGCGHDSTTYDDNTFEPIEGGVIDSVRVFHDKLSGVIWFKTYQGDLEPRINADGTPMTFEQYKALLSDIG